jgi:zearalenone synthase (nonreducing iterative type I polyketide synthase)
MQKQVGDNYANIVASLGVDSIMGIEIAAGVNSSANVDLVPSFMMEYPTVGDLRNSFGQEGPRTSTPNPEPPSDYSIIGDTPESSANSTAASVENLSAPTEHDSKAHSSKLDIEKDMVIVPSPVDDGSPAPSTRVTLLQGRASSGKRPFYLIADGTGSIATYIHLPPFKSKMPVYGIDSPYLRCPSRLATGGIEGAATYIVDALLKFQPEGPFSIGGFSGGAMVGYEVCRRLAAAGRSVDRLLLIDMCCPRPIGASDKAEVGWKVYESIANQGGMWRTSNSTQQHLRSIFASVANYHPPPMTDNERPKRVAIIWAKKGLIDRCSNDAALMKLLDANDIPTKAFPGFMEDPKMGAIAWGLPHKTAEDLGPNGWDRYVGKTLDLAIDADHLEMPMPSHVHLLHGAMEEAFAYLDETKE